MMALADLLSNHSNVSIYVSFQSQNLVAFASILERVLLASNCIASDFPALRFEFGLSWHLINAPGSFGVVVDQHVATC